jgi:Membrane-associating domain
MVITLFLRVAQVSDLRLVLRCLQERLTFLVLLQLLFAAVVIALSAVLINGYGPGHNPSIIDYGAFCGGAGLIIAVVGIAAIFFDALQGIIVLALDAFAAFFLLAGGLVSRPRNSWLVSTHRLTGICRHD